MLYYRVKKEYDQHKRDDGDILVQNELYTPKEKERYNIPDKCLEIVEVKKTDIYWFFGARFSGEA